MGFNDTMDIRGIAWAGYFFDPDGGIQTRYICAEPPDIDADEYIPSMTDADEIKIAPIITDADADTPC
jgi:hypothetical protein